MNVDLNTVIQGLKYFADVAIVKPINSFIENEHLKDNRFGQAKIIGKTIAIAYASKIIGGILLGMPTVAAIGGGLYAFKYMNDHYDLKAKLFDESQREELIKQISDVYAQARAAF